MKVAICYSGEYRIFPNWQENHKWALGDFNADIYYSTWLSEKDKVEKSLDMIYFDQPVIDYDLLSIPEFILKYGDMRSKQSEKIRRYTGNLQILAHQLLIDCIPDYDVIIRLRYDTWFFKNNWVDFVEDSYTKRIVFGFGYTQQHFNYDINYCKTWHRNIKDFSFIDKLFDFVIIHPKHKMKNTFTLHLEKKLFTTHPGWYQVLCEPYPKNEFENISGGVTLWRFLEKIK